MTIGIIIGLISLVFLVTMHELGHFIMARRNGVEVEEFGICFPPRAIAWRKVDGKWTRLKREEWTTPPGEGLIISLNWLPIGGFCQMKGENDDDSRKGSFGKASFWGKTKILFGGVLANWLVAIALLTGLAWLGMPNMIDGQFTVKSDTHKVAKRPLEITEVIRETPASFAGLAVGDRIERVCGEQNKDCMTVVDGDDLVDFDAQHAGEVIYMTYLRDNQRATALVNLNDSDAEYILGVKMTSESVNRSTWSAPIVGVGLTAQLTGETFKGIGGMLKNLCLGVVSQISTKSEVREDGREQLAEAGDAVSGPIGIIGVLFPAVTSLGLGSIIFLIALISVSLACMNVLPIPALDGGRWLMIALSRLRDKKLSKKTEENVVGWAFLVLIILAVVVTILDVIRIVK